MIIHRKAIRAGIVPVTALAITAAGVGWASAEPIELGSQGGVTSATPSTQGGVTGERQYWTAPPAQPREYAPLPGYDYELNTYTRPSTTPPPLDLSTLRAPQPVDVDPIYEAPDRFTVIGDYHFRQANWVTDEDRDRTNNTAGLIRSDVSTFYKSIGVDARRADRVAAAQIGGFAAGALAGGAVGAVPGALIGSTIGGIAGASLGGIVPLPIPLLPEVTTGVAGTAAGAAIGGAIGGAIGAVPGALIGVTAGTAFGAGDDDGQPIVIDLPDVDADALAAMTAANVDQAQGSGPQAQAVVSAVQGAFESAPGVDAQVREFVAAQPGGVEVIAHADAALDTFFSGSAGTAAEMISTAVHAGLSN